MAGDGAHRRRNGGGEERAGYQDKDRGSQYSVQSGFVSGKAGAGASRDRGDREGKPWVLSRHGQNGSAQPRPPVDLGIALPAALRGVEEASEPTEQSLRCAAAVLESAASGKGECETVLAKLNSWLVPSGRQVMMQIASSALPDAVVRGVIKFRDEPLTAALCCNVLVRSSGTAEGAAAYLRAGAFEEVGGLMDRHSAHGGVQNVCLIVLCGLMKEGHAARQAVNSGALPRVLRALEATTGREVQVNGLSALRLLAEQGRAQRAGLQEAALRAKVGHQSDNAVVAAADEVLALVTPRFKEVLCWHWQSGWCKLGPRCTYAHGPSDLRGH